MSQNVKIKQLSNGLTLLAEPNSSQKSAALGFFVKTGSRDETKEEAGISHFLEHMMFKGTAKRNAIELTFDLGNIGAQANAYTSEENTVYYSAILPEYFSNLQEILSDMLRPSIVQEEFDTEKNVILEEIALYQDRPNFYLFENSMAEFFAGHTAGNSVLGSTSSVSAITSTQMKDYFRRRYSPSNMVLTASGNIDWKKFVQDAENLTSDWVDFKTSRKVDSFKSKPVTKDFHKKNLTLAHFLLMCDGCPTQDDHKYALNVLSVILGDGTGSKMYWELVDSGLADSASFDSDERDGCGVTMAYASTEPQKLDIVAEKMQKIISNPLDFDQDDLQRAKTKIATRVVFSGELPMGRLMALGNHWNYFNEVHSLENELAKYNAVTKDSIAAAIAKYPLKDFSQFKLLPE